MTAPADKPKGPLVRGRDALSPQMLAVLEAVIEPHPEDDPFPPTGTVRALERRGLIRLIGAREAAANGAGTMDIIMASLGACRIVATAAGRRAYRRAKAAHLSNIDTLDPAPVGSGQTGASLGGGDA